jgi:hypothetical protein
VAAGDGGLVEVTHGHSLLHFELDLSDVRGIGRGDRGGQSIQVRLNREGGVGKKVRSRDFVLLFGRRRGRDRSARENDVVGVDLGGASITSNRIGALVKMNPVLGGCSPVAGPLCVRVRVDRANGEDFLRG